MAVANKTVNAEPVVIDKIRPVGAHVPRNEPSRGRSVILASRPADG
jgi:hypothetical protein